MLSADTAFWREDIDSLAFYVDQHEGLCVMHRRAFRALLGFDPTPQQCLDYFEQRRVVFVQSARNKIERAKIPSSANFHITSRDIRRAV